MLRTWMSLLVNRPDLLVDHLVGYVVLVRQEAADASSAWIKRIICWVVTGLFALLFLLIAAIALMLWGTHGFHWSLAAVPGAFLLVTIIAFVFAKRPVPTEQFADLKGQIDADMQAFQAARGGV